MDKFGRGARFVHITSDLAFDGELSVAPEKPVDWARVLREMQDRGIRAGQGEKEDLVLEADVEAAWNALSPLVAPPASPSSRQQSSPGPSAGRQPTSLLDLLAEDAPAGQTPYGPAEQLALFDLAEPSEETGDAA